MLLALATRASGLTSAEAVTRLERFGPNALSSRRVTLLGVLVRQLRNPLLLLLVAAAIVSAMTGDVADGGIIVAIVALSVGLGLVNEYRSERTVHALHSNITHRTDVWRDGGLTRLDVCDLVPGDVVELGVGDLVPADLRLLEVRQLECEEAVLTGESTSAIKTVDPTVSDSATDLASCAFMGTVVHQGSGRGVVVSTGTSTAFGAIAAGLSARQVDTAFGVNDAIALHAADVGISVQTATDVAKDAADIVLLDKDLGVLADGVAEGRRICGAGPAYSSSRSIRGRSSCS